MNPVFGEGTELKSEEVESRIEPDRQGHEFGELLVEGLVGGQGGAEEHPSPGRGHL